MDQALLWACAIGLAGLAILSTVARATEPQPISIEQAPAHSGRAVVLEARIVAMDALRSGAMRIVLAEANASLPVFVREPVSALPGDVVRATGRITLYHGQWELVVDSPEDVEVSVAWDERRLAASELVERPWAYAGTYLVTWGLVDGDRPSRRELVDPASGIRIAYPGAEASEEPGEHAVRLVYSRSLVAFHLEPVVGDPLWTRGS